MEQARVVTDTAGRPVDATATVTVSLGKGAWDCDTRCPIPPEKEVLSRLPSVVCHDASVQLGAC